VRILIGEDEALLREGLTLVLAQHDLEIVGTSGDADELVVMSARLAPDLVLTDIRMPPTRTDDGLQAALRIRAERPTTAVVLLSQFVQRRYAMELLADGGGRVGYLLKQRVLDSLSARRREVLSLIAEGLSNAAIARRLVITEKSVVAHTSGIYDALGLPPDGDEHRRVLAVIHYLGR